MLDARNLLGAILAGTLGLCLVGNALSQSGPPATQPASEPASRPGNQYRIKIFRPEKAGQNCQVVLSGTREYERSVSGQQEQAEKTNWGFEVKGFRKVLTVDANGMATRSSLTCESCVEIVDRIRTDLLAKGGVAIVTCQDGKIDVRAEDPNITLSATAKNVLYLAVYMPLLPGMDFDSWFGTDKPVRIGESWPVKSKTIADASNRRFQSKLVRESDITGRGTLTGLEEVDGVEYMVVRIDMTIKADGPLEEGMTEHKVQTITAVTLHLPLDRSLPLIGNTRKEILTRAIKYRAPDGKEVRLEDRTERIHSGRSVPAGAASTPR